jgi:UPF0716 protein FxsA
VLIRLSLLLIIVPLLELVLLLTLADVVGSVTTLAVVVITGISGAWLLRRQGLRTLRNIAVELHAGRLPSTDLLDGVLLLMAGVLLLTPGVLTDLVGIALLIPITRSIFRRWLVEYFKRRWRVGVFPGPGNSPMDRSSEVIDSYVVPSKDHRE